MISSNPVPCGGRFALPESQKAKPRSGVGAVGAQLPALLNRTFDTVSNATWSKMSGLAGRKMMGG